MSNKTNEINKITTTIISISVKLIFYAMVILLLYEGVVKGFAFGHEVFFAEAVDRAPGRDVTVTIEDDETVSETADMLAGRGIIKSEFAFLFQSRFYEYDTIYPGTYTLNTSMTSKEILQKLNEKPDEEAKEAQSGNARTAAETKAPRAAEETQGQSVEQTVPQTAETEAPNDEGVSDGQNANDQTYAGEDEDIEGGWIEDVTEGTAQ